MDISTTPEPNNHKETKEPKEPKEPKVIKDPIYSNKISLEEYNKQKDDFTQKALKELSEQMKTFEKPKENKEENKVKSKSAFNIINTNYYLIKIMMRQITHTIINWRNIIFF